MYDLESIKTALSWMGILVIAAIFLFFLLWVFKGMAESTTAESGDTGCGCLFALIFVLVVGLFLVFVAGIVK